MAKKRGGFRPGAGRNPVKDKVIGLSIYLRKSEIRNFGGEKKTKQRIYDLLEIPKLIKK